MKKVFSTILATALVASMSAAVNPHFDMEVGYDQSNRTLNTDIVGVGYENGMILNSNMNGFHFGGTFLIDFAGDSAKSLPGVSIGLNYQFLCANGWMSPDGYKHDKQSWMDATYKGSSTTNLVYKDFIHVHSIQVPIRFQYGYQINNFRIFAFTGPQLRIHVAEKTLIEQTYDVKKLVDAEKEEYEYKKWGIRSESNLISGKQSYTKWVNGEKAEGKDIDKKNEDIKKDERQPIFDVAWGFGLGFGWKSVSLNVSYDLGMINMLSKKDKQDFKDMGAKYIVNDNVLAVTLGIRFQ